MSNIDGWTPDTQTPLPDFPQPLLVLLSFHIIFLGSNLVLPSTRTSVSLSHSQSLLPNETETVLPVGKEVSAPETNTCVRNRTRARTLTHVRTLTHKRHRQTVTHKSHLYYAEHQLADGGADYAVTLRQPTTPCWISAFKAQSQMSFQHINRELYIPKQWDPHTYSFLSTCSSHLVTVCGHFKR